MVTDIAFPFQYAEDGDLETVNGTEFYEQHALLLALDAQTTVRGTPVTANEITEVESELTDLFSESPFLTEPTVSVVETGAEALTLRVEIAEVTPFDVNVPTGDQ